MYIKTSYDVSYFLLYIYSLCILVANMSDTWEFLILIGPGIHFGDALISVATAKGPSGLWYVQL